MYGAASSEIAWYTYIGTCGTSLRDVPCVFWRATSRYAGNERRSLAARLLNRFDSRSRFTYLLPSTFTFANWLRTSGIALRRE